MIAVGWEGGIRQLYDLYITPCPHEIPDQSSHFGTNLAAFLRLTDKTFAAHFCNLCLKIHIRCKDSGLLPILNGLFASSRVAYFSRR